MSGNRTEPMAMDARRDWAAGVDESVAPEKLTGYPSMRKAARILGVDVSTLSRRADVQARVLRRGQELLLSPDLVLELAGHFHRRRLSAVAAALMAHAVENAPAEYVDEIESEIDEALARQRKPVNLPPSGFLREARRALPADLYAEVERVYTAEAPHVAGSADLGEGD
ncbi:MAG: hypothetical protein ACTHNU_11780 [Gaiellales bacterium]